jgi:hypothetical protein
VILLLKIKKKKKNPQNGQFPYSERVDAHIWWVLTKSNTH